jgi:hypothetical protein
MVELMTQRVTTFEVTGPSFLKEKSAIIALTPRKSILTVALVEAVFES